ncbi:MAG: hypothetical protein FXF47_04480 [Candidatus Mcinerneyibacterium aminivorans]|uniref:Tetratricopeptide repeat protein n=1 Tax=Candidatus Mcinerneyibacterium aminivorans TaxID=2703815 RepID=A0A5D0MIZ5_9BACT|nr:MAG: hypothetical protein FXF47_04480 [Candidatus Mcinerneyibacterium aminivorans]
MASIERTISRADKLIKNGKLEDAKFKIQDALMENPNNEKLLWKLIDIYKISGKDKNSVKNLRKIIDNNLSPKKKIINYIKNTLSKKFRNSKEVYFLYYEMELKEGNLENAINALKTLSESTINELLENKKQKYKKLKKINEEKKLIKNNTELFYHLFYLNYALNNFDSAYKYINKIIKNNIKNMFAELIETLSRLQEIDKNNPYNYFYLGKLYLKEEKIDKALTQLIKGVKINNALADPIINLVDSYKIENDYPFTNRLLARCYYLNQNFEKTVEFLQQYYDKNKTDNTYKFVKNLLSEIQMNIGPKSYVLLLAVEIEIDRENYENAYRKFIQIKEYNSPLIEKYGNILLDNVDNKAKIYEIIIKYFKEINNSIKAFQYLKELFKNNKKYVDFVLHELKGLDNTNLDKVKYKKLMGDIYTYNKKLKSAYLSYKSIIENYPDYSDIAIEGFENLLSNSPDTLKLRELLIDLYMDHSKYVKALKIIGFLVTKDKNYYYDYYDHLTKIIKHNQELIPKIIRLLTILDQKGINKDYILYNQIYLDYYYREDYNLLFKHFKDIQKSHNENLIDNSNNFIKSCANENPNNVEIQWVLANIYLLNNKYEKAFDAIQSIYKEFKSEEPKVLNFIDKLIKNNFVNDSIIQTYTEICIDNKKWDKLERFLQNIEANFDVAGLFSLFISKIKLYYNKNKLKKIFDNLKILVNSNGNINLNEIKNIIEELGKVIEPNPEYYYILGKYYLLINERQKSLYYYKDQIGKSEKYDGKIENDLLNLNDKNKGDFKILQLLGELYFKNDEYDKSLTYLNQALSINKDIINNVLEYYREISIKTKKDRYDIDYAKASAISGNYEKSYEIMSTIKPDKEDYLKYIKTLRAIIKIDGDFWKLYNLLGDVYLENNNIADAVENYKIILDKIDIEKISQIYKTIQNDYKNLENAKIKIFLLNLSLILKKDSKEISNNIKNINKSDNTNIEKIIKLLEKYNNTLNNKIILKDYTRLLILLDDYKELFNKIKNKIEILKDEEKFLEHVFKKLFKREDIRNEVLDFYINFHFSRRNIKNLNDIFNRLKEFNIGRNNLKKYLMIYAAINKNNSEKYQKIIRKLKKFIKNKNELHKIYTQIQKQKNEIWKNYYEKSDKIRDKVKLLNIYSEEGNYDKIKTLLDNNNFKENYYKEMIFYKLKYYFNKNDYYSFFLEVDNFKFDSLSLSKIDIKIIEYVINFYLDINMFNKAKYYLHYLKGFLDNNEYNKILYYINKNKYEYNANNNSYFLLK